MAAGRPVISIDVHVESTGAPFKGGASDTAEATKHFVDEAGGVGTGVVADDLASGVADTDMEWVRE